MRSDKIKKASEWKNIERKSGHSVGGNSRKDSSSKEESKKKNNEMIFLEVDIEKNGSERTSEVIFDLDSGTLKAKSSHKPSADLTDPSSRLHTALKEGLAGRKNYDRFLDLSCRFLRTFEPSSRKVDSILKEMESKFGFKPSEKDFSALNACENGLLQGNDIEGKLQAFFIDWDKKAGEEVLQETLDLVTPGRIEKGLVLQKETVLYCRYCTSDGDIPGIVKLTSRGLKFQSFYPDSLLRASENICLQINYGDIHKDGILETVIPTDKMEENSDEMIINYYIEIPVYRTHPPEPDPTTPLTPIKPTLTTTTSQPLPIASLRLSLPLASISRTYLSNTFRYSLVTLFMDSLKHYIQVYKSRYDVVDKVGDLAKKSDQAKTAENDEQNLIQEFENEDLPTQIAYFDIIFDNVYPKYVESLGGSKLQYVNNNFDRLKDLFGFQRETEVCMIRNTCFCPLKDVFYDLEPPKKENDFFGFNLMQLDGENEESAPDYSTWFVSRAGLVLTEPSRIIKDSNAREIRENFPNYLRNAKWKLKYDRFQHGRSYKT